MDQNKPDTRRKGGERKSPTLGNNLILFMLAIGVATLFVVGVLFKGADYEIPYSKLVALIKQGNPQQNPKASVTVPERIGSDKPTEVRYSNIRDVVVGPYEATGKVIRQEPNHAAEDVRFRTALWGLEGDKGQLRDLLIASEFENVRGESQ